MAGSVIYPGPTRDDTGRSRDLRTNTILLEAMMVEAIQVHNEDGSSSDNTKKMDITIAIAITITYVHGLAALGMTPQLLMSNVTKKNLILSRLLQLVIPHASN
jgi:hypothetical protein